MRAGDFSAIPVPFTWEECAEFSHLIDAYELTGSVDACFAILDRVLQEIRFTGHSTASPLDIWVVLFFRHRGRKHAGHQPNRDRRALLDLLCEPAARPAPEPRTRAARRHFGCHDRAEELIAPPLISRLWLENSGYPVSPKPSETEPSNPGW